jgi:hypothetical protein
MSCPPLATSRCRCRINEIGYGNGSILSQKLAAERAFCHALWAANWHVRPGARTTTRSNCDESEEFHPSRMAGTRLKIRPQSPSHLTARRRSPVFAGIAVEEQSVSVTERSGIIIVALSLLYLPLPASSPCAESFSAARTLARHRDLRAPSRDHVSGCSTLDENRQRGAGSKSLGFTSP